MELAEWLYRSRWNLQIMSYGHQLSIYPELPWTTLDCSMTLPPAAPAAADSYSSLPGQHQCNCSGNVEPAPMVWLCPILWCPFWDDPAGHALQAPAAAAAVERLAGSQALYLTSELVFIFHTHCLVATDWQQMRLLHAHAVHGG